MRFIEPTVEPRGERGVSARPKSRSGRVSRTLLATLAALSVMAGCSSPSVLSPDRAAKEISDVLEQQLGKRPDGVACPAEIDAEVGNQMRCELTDGGDTYGVTVTITSVADGQAKFDIVVDESPS